MFTEALHAILQDHCTPAHVRAIETSPDRANALWQAVAGAGFLELMATEKDGGAGLGLAEVRPLLELLGACAMPLPVGQAIALRALLQPGSRPPEGIITLAPALRRQADGTLMAPQLPFGLLADQVVGALEGELWLLDAGLAKREPLGLYRDSLCHLRWEPAAVRHARCLETDATAQDLEAWGAALHAALLAGALGRSFDLALAFCNDRIQFGRSIGKFQAIQHQLAVMAEHVAATRIAVASAFASGERRPMLLAAAFAKARASEAAGLIAPMAHAVHGAIGVTEEYELQLHTRRLHAWRMAHGSEAHWHRVVGEALLDSGERIGDFVRSVQGS
ncbi:acyl-CoA dehydrogenase family protein [uncultured Pseudacidovorax sp.]|uniref:acyl-CoA dehydrogenase family protein n=1 Tax=uncultured Pseudacidovorax sp. TaxID=679313 RepID=UPI0025F0503E|nr:acyl-CoA dehydrogenase family protein [uncultured Pseudacidovorax sp.]